MKWIVIGLGLACSAMVVWCVAMAALIVSAPKRPSVPQDASISIRPFVHAKHGLVTFGLHPLKDDERK